MKNISFREKSAWISLISTIVVFVPYFLHALPLAVQGELELSAALRAFIVVIVLEIVAIVAVNIIKTIIARGKESELKLELKDERDITIELKSYKYAYLVITSVWVVILCAIAFVAIPLIDGGILAPSLTPHLLGPAFLSQILILSFVSAEVVKYGIQIVGYRRS